MYDKCESCGRMIFSSDDCRLLPGRDGIIRTLCTPCSSREAKDA